MTLKKGERISFSAHYSRNRGCTVEHLELYGQYVGKTSFSDQTFDLVFGDDEKQYLVPSNSVVKSNKTRTHYYYLLGSERKGPFNLKKMFQLNLGPDTLIWAKGLDDWQPLKVFPEFMDKVTAPPAPPLAETEISFEIENKIQQTVTTKTYITPPSQQDKSKKNKQQEPYQKKIEPKPSSSFLNAVKVFFGIVICISGIMTSADMYGEAEGESTAVIGVIIGFVIVMAGGGYLINSGIKPKHK